MTPRVAILGPGRAGRSIANALGAAGITVDLIGRDAPMTSADVILVTVRDADLPFALAGLRELHSGAVVLHASGVSDPAAELNALREAGHPTGTFHPLVPLADPDVGASILRGAWIGVDGDVAAVTVAEKLAASIGAHVLRIPAGAKAGYHAAAVMAANFPAVLAAAAEREMRCLGVAPESAHGAVAHLMRTSLENVAALGPERAMTGPVSRGDVGTIERNLAALTADRAVYNLYVAGTRLAIEIARAEGTDPERLAEIEATLRHS